MNSTNEQIETLKIVWMVILIPIGVVIVYFCIKGLTVDYYTYTKYYNGEESDPENGC